MTVEKQLTWSINAKDNFSKVYSSTMKRAKEENRAFGNVSENTWKDVAHAERQAVEELKEQNKKLKESISTTNRLKSAFRGMGSVVRSAFRIPGGIFKQLFSLKSLLGGLAVGAGIRAAVNELKSLSAEHLNDAEAVKDLDSALRTNGKSVALWSAEYQAAASEIQSVTRIGDDQSLSLMRQAVNLGINTTKIVEATKGAIGLADVLDIDLASAMQYVAMGLNGNFQMLSRYIPAIRNATTEEEKHTALLEFLARGYAQAQESAKQLTGQIDQNKNAWGDVREKLGAFIVKAVEASGVMGKIRDTIASVDGWVVKNSDTLQGYATLITGKVVDAITSVRDKIAEWANDGTLFTWLAYGQHALEVFGAFAKATFASIVKGFEFVFSAAMKTGVQTVAGLEAFNKRSEVRDRRKRGEITEDQMNAELSKLPTAEEASVEAGRKFGLAERSYREQRRKAGIKDENVGDLWSNAFGLVKKGFDPEAVRGGYSQMLSNMRFKGLPFESMSKSSSDPSLLSGQYPYVNMPYYKYGDKGTFPSQQVPSPIPGPIGMVKDRSAMTIAASRQASAAMREFYYGPSAGFSSMDRNLSPRLRATVAAEDRQAEIRMQRAVLQAQRKQARATSKLARETERMSSENDNSVKDQERAARSLKNHRSRRGR